MLMPRKVKHRKQHHPDRHGHGQGRHRSPSASSASRRSSPAYVTTRQIEAARIAMTRHIKRGGKVWITSSRTGRHQEAGRDPHGFRQG